MTKYRNDCKTNALEQIIVLGCVELIASRQTNQFYQALLQEKEDLLRQKDEEIDFLRTTIANISSRVGILENRLSMQCLLCIVNYVTLWYLSCCV